MAVATTLLKADKLCSITNVALRVAIVSERIAGGLTFAQNAYNIGKIGIQMYCKYGIMGESLGLDTVGEALSIGFSAMGCYSGLYSMGHTSNRLLALQGQAEAGMLCFVAGTKVRTPDGDRNIEDIAIGVEVWSCDAETGDRKQACDTPFRQRSARYCPCDDRQRDHRCHYHASVLCGRVWI